MTAREIRSAVITGPTGAIGAALCRSLLEHDVTVYAVVRPESSRVSALPQAPGLRIIPCDLSAMQTLPEKLPEKHADAFFHLGWMQTTGAGRNCMPAQIDNIRCASDAAAAAHKLGCRVFIGAGSQAEYGRVSGALKPDTPCFPENGYGMAKLCAGAMTRIQCEEYGIAHIWMRVLSVYGPYDGKNAMIPVVIRKLLSGETPKMTGCEQIWDYLYSKDAAEAFRLAALSGRNSAVYPLGSGCARPLREYVEMLRDCVNPGAKIEFGAVPYAEKQVMHLEADLSAIRNDTGFVPACGFAEGIAETVSFFRG